MTVSEMIAALEAFRAEHGDLEVHTLGFYERYVHHGPVLDYVKVLRPRERSQAFFTSYLPVDQKGPAVCRM